jgi:hypothetical protein
MRYMYNIDASGNNFILPASMNGDFENDCDDIDDLSEKYKDWLVTDDHLLAKLTFTNPNFEDIKK